MIRVRRQKLLKSQKSQKLQKTKASLLFWISLSLLISGSLPAWSAPDQTYYTIEDNQPSPSGGLMDPQVLLLEGVQALSRINKNLNLLTWVRHTGPLPLPSEPYNRRLQFGGWVNDPRDKDCYNTRAVVLMRDSKAPVTFRQTNRCIVDTGEWHEPYSGLVVTSAKALQIDHMVPLKHAYMMGASRWSPKKRCLYANFTANDFHLIAADSHENMAKGDDGPDQFLPANERYVCQYLKNWLAIKMIWSLRMSSAEASAIRTELQDYGCDLRELSFSNVTLAQQRKAMVVDQEICANFGNAPAFTDLKTLSSPAEVSYQADERQSQSQ